jgi:NAD+ kinase
MKRPRILVVYKKSAFQLYALEKKEPKVRALIRRKAPHTTIMERSHEAHTQALESVVAACRSLGADVKRIYRAHLRSTTAADLVVTVGGDGTVLDASHRILDVPLLGVNSNPARSVGFLTGANAANVGDVLEGIFSRRIQPRKLMRLQVSVNGKQVGVPVLNDILFCHSNPAATSRYTIKLGRSAEEQKSSGIWVASPTGSTAAIMSAGGEKDDMDARRFQYRVREPYAAPGKVVNIVGGFVGRAGKFTVLSQLRNAAVFLDGPHLKFPVGMGDVLEVSAHPSVLRLFRPR